MTKIGKIAINLDCGRPGDWFWYYDVVDGSRDTIYVGIKRTDYDDIRMIKAYVGPIRLTVAWLKKDQSK